MHLCCGEVHAVMGRRHPRVIISENIVHGTRDTTHNVTYIAFHFCKGKRKKQDKQPVSVINQYQDCHIIELWLL